MATSQGVNVSLRSRTLPSGNCPCDDLHSLLTRPSTQVLRYSALVAGLVYGAYHQSSLNAHAKAAEIEREYKRKEALIEQAKAEWRKKNAPPEQKAETGGSMSLGFVFP